MAKIIGNVPSGKINNIIIRRTRYGLVLSAAPSTVNNPRTNGQMRNRTQMGNLGACNTLLREVMAFEGKQPRHTDYNLFVRENLNRCPVYLTKRESGTACVVAPYLFTRGSLPAIGYGLTAGGILMSDLSLGDLVIDADTTVADLSEALIAHNPHWHEGDQLSFVIARQRIDDSGIPTARKDIVRLILNTTDAASARPLWDEVGALGFTSIQVPEPVEGPTRLGATDPGRSIEGPTQKTKRSTKKLAATYCLGMAEPLINAGAAWVHTRHPNLKKLLVSTQSLHVESSILASYQSDDAFHRAAKSYGCFSDPIYLAPETEG